MELYGKYAPFYDLTQGNRGQHYQYLLKKFHPNAKSILELACGTGANLLPLSDHYEVVGLDISSTMLKYARKKLPGIKFYRQDMAGFKLKHKFDVIICPYDSINHLLKFNDWIRTFTAAKRHLNERGIFIFDINTEHNLHRMAAAPAWVYQFDNNYLIIDVKIINKGTFDWDIKVFEQQRNKTYRLHHEIIKERSFPHEKVKSTLQRNFNEVRTYDFINWSRPKKTTNRLFYVCRNKSN